MRKGSLKLLLSAAIVALGTAVYAASPVLDTLPIVVISDAENQSSTEDWNLFVFTDAFAFGDLVADADTPDAALKWTFDIGAGGTGDLTINDVVDITTSSDDPANPASPINTAAGATFREVALSPGLSTDPITVPFADPSAITATMGQPADIDGDSQADELVGELVVSFMVADDQNDIAKVATGNTFVWTYDTDLGGASRPGDALVDQGLTFETVDLVIGSDPIGPGAADWYFRSWSQGGGGTALTADWLTDAVSGTVGTSPFSAFEITGAGNASQNGSFGAAHGEWIAPGDPLSLFQAGKVYSARAALGLDGVKQDTDQPRIGLQENTVANINQTYVINAPTQPIGITGTSPFLAAAGSTREYISTVDPIDADLAFNDVIGDGAELYYLFNFDFVNVIAVAVRTATMASFELGSADSATYNQNAAAVMTYGGGAGENDFADWSRIAPIPPLALVGGATLLVDITSATASAGNVVITCGNTTDATGDISFGEMANFNGAADIDDLNVTADAAYRADYAIAMNGGSAAGVSPGNTYGIPSLRLRAATPIPSFSIEYIVTPRNTNGFPTEDVAATHELYWTASTQYATGTSVGEEDDQQVIFGIQDFEWTDGTATLSGLTVYELNSSDPNVDY